MERTFIFNGYEEGENGEVKFEYIIKSDSGELVFTEKLTFPHADFEQIPEPLRHRLLMNLVLVLGISYWKLYCPKNIEIKYNQLTKEQADFWNTLYTKGLGEFFYRNNIDFRGLIQFPYTHGDNADTVAFERQNRSLLMLGGGKDSIVSAELLRENKKDFSSFAVNEYPLQGEIAKLLNTDLIVVKREIDPMLIELSKGKEAYNGHVPVSAIYAFISLLSAALYDFRYIISSNEASANDGNVEYLGEFINHQWSKSIEFENLFGNYVKKYLTDDIIYFSILRPLYEIKIAQIFTNYPQYFSSFSSCNRNFTIVKSIEKKWCGLCPKCAFVFILLAAFLPKEYVVEMFGKNLLYDASLVDLYRQLLGIKDIKPFECVGTPDEVALAFYLTYQKKEFEEEICMRMFEKEVLPVLKNVDELEKKLLSVQKEELLPSEFAEIIHTL